MATSSRKVKLLKAFLYPLFFILMLVLGVLWTFPMDALRARVEVEASRQLGGRVRIGELGLRLPTTAVLRDVQANLPEGGSFPAMTLRADELLASATFATITGGPIDIQLDAKLLGGTLEGRYWQEPADGRLEGRFAALNLSPLKYNLHDDGFPVSGIATGSLDLTVDGAGSQVAGEGAKRSRRLGRNQITGRIELAVSEGALGEGMVRGFTIPALRFGSLLGKLKLDKSRLNIEQFELDGPDITGKIDGYLSVRGSLVNSSARGTVELKPAPAFLETNETIGLALQMVGADKYARPDGTYAIRVTGRLGSPRLTRL